ncbi:hypothetical protein BU17DRAFT_56271, partial [Hysterangium stoloniferum]
HPLSLIVLGIWTSYIVATIFLLEQAAAAAPRSVDQPWIFNVLPSLMLTFFTQGHISVTALHLSRVAVSAIQQESTAPHSWAELFWLADHEWSGPIGLASAVITMIKWRIRASLTFFIFAFTCMVALATPVILSHAYGVGPVDVTVNTTITPNTFSLNETTNIDRIMQMGIGISSWTTGLSVLDIYDASIFTPEGSSREVPNDLFFAGNILDSNATLPGLRLQGSCEPLSDEASIAVVQNTTLFFSEFCDNSFSTISYSNHGNVSVQPDNVTITVNYCSDAADVINYIGDRDSTAYIFLQTNNGTVSTSGVIKCQSFLSFGSASLWGTQGTYNSFRDFPYNNSQAQTEAINPLGSTLVGLIDAMDPSLCSPFSPNCSKDEKQSMLLKQLGYHSTGIAGDLHYVQPGLDIFASRIWLGVTHMTAGLGLLFRSSDTAYPAVVRHATSGRTRSSQFVVGSCVLLALWMYGLIYVSIRSYRLSIDSSLGSYVAARLHAEDTRLYPGDEPLWDGRAHSDELSGDERLNGPFLSESWIAVNSYNAVPLTHTLDSRQQGQRNVGSNTLTSEFSLTYLLTLHAVAWWFSV